MTKTIASIAALLLAAVACRKAAKPAEPSHLQAAVQGLSGQAPCDKLIPMEWPASWPVPTGKDGGREFKLFFYPLTSMTAKVPPKVCAPMGEAVFDAKTGKPSACTRLPGRPQELEGPRWGPKADAMSMDDFEASRARLYRLSEDVAALYAAKVQTSPEQRAKVAEYAGLFMDLSEPPLLPRYRDLNPEFWAWASANGAKTVP